MESHQCKKILFLIIVHQMQIYFYLQKISQSSTVMLDRWSISVSDEERDKSEPIIRANDKIPYNIINNYFSIGVVRIVGFS